MSQRYQFTTVDTILAKYSRDFRGLDISEDDAIEWIGEALGFMKFINASVEKVALLEVKNYQASLPNGLHYIIQIAKNNNVITPLDIEVNDSEIISPTLEGNVSSTPQALRFDFTYWSNSNKTRGFTPVRLSNHSFFNTLVCTVPELEGLYHSCSDEYTIVQDELRFSFKEGYVAVAYIGSLIDECTGYPMIPDDESAKAAITYYLGWKVKEQEAWNHRAGSLQLSQLAESKWLKYIKQFRNASKMPSGVDEHQDLLEQSKYLLPNDKRYYGFFGKLGKAENRVFNNPDSRNKRR